MKVFFYKLLFPFLERAISIYWFVVYRQFYKKYSIDPSFVFNGHHVDFYGDGKIEIKKDSYIGSSSYLQVPAGNCITIGEGCMISHNVRIYTSSVIADQDFSKKPFKEKNGDVVIGNYVWIGANVFINPGITIGDHAVIGANSVVTKNVEPDSIVGGVPARLIKYKTRTL